MRNAVKNTRKRQAVTNNQLVMMNNALVKLKPSVTMDDKMMFRKRTKLSIYIINKYLRGDGPSLTTATRAFVFFNNQIIKREQSLSNA